MNTLKALATLVNLHAAEGVPKRKYSNGGMCCARWPLYAVFDNELVQGKV